MNKFLIFVVAIIICACMCGGQYKAFLPKSSFGKIEEFKRNVKRKMNNIKR